MLQQVSRESINKLPITTHLSVNKNQSVSVHYKVPPIRRQGQILTLVQIYWRSKIIQLSQATRGFLTFSLFSSHRFAALLLENLWHPGYNSGYLLILFICLLFQVYNIYYNGKHICSKRYSEFATLHSMVRRFSIGTNNIQLFQKALTIRKIETIKTT